MPRPVRTLVFVALACGVTVPVLYFGTQLVATPFYPDYSFLRNVASELGSDRSSQPSVFNTGAILTGLACLAFAIGFPIALRRAGGNLIVGCAVAVAGVSCGAGSIWAGLFPLPDPRHNPGPVGVGMFLMPLLFAVASWTVRGGWWLRWYLLANLIAFATLIPIMSGTVGMDTREYGGLLQRVAASVVFLPFGVVGVALGRRLRASGRAEGDEHVG